MTRRGRLPQGRDGLDAGLREPVAGAGIAVHLDVLVRQEQPSLHLHQFVLADQRVVLGEVAEHGCDERVELDVLRPVVGHDGAHRRRLAGRHPQRPRGPHREADHCHRVLGHLAVRPKRHDAVEHQRRRQVRVRLDQQPLRLVRIGRHHPAAQVGRQRRVAGVGQLLDDVLHRPGEAPPRVQHQHAGARAVVGLHQIGRADGGSAVHPQRLPRQAPAAVTGHPAAVGSCRPCPRPWQCSTRRVGSARPP